jgi:hypothetical protein
LSKVIIEQIADKTRMLQATWTIDMAKDLKTSHGVDIEEELGKVLQEEIDWEILVDLMTKGGWHTVKVRTLPMLEADTRPEWIADNIKGRWNHRLTTYLFELEQDATLFALKWA